MMISSLFNQAGKGYFSHHLPLAGPVVLLSSWVSGPDPEPGRPGADAWTMCGPHHRCADPATVGN